MQRYRTFKARYQNASWRSPYWIRPNVEAEFLHFLGDVGAAPLASSLSRPLVSEVHSYKEGVLQFV